MPLSFPLQTDRLLIEPMTVADAPALSAYRSVPEVARFQSWDAPFPLERAERMLAANPAGWPEQGEWVQLALRAERGLVGDLAVHPLDDPAQPATIEVGVTLTPRAQGNGFASEALAALLAACFAAGLHRAVAATDARNVQVARVLTRVGMRREGRLVDAERWKDEWATIDLWALLAEEHAAARG